MSKMRGRIRQDRRSKMPDVPKGWESKMRSARKHHIGTVLTAEEVEKLGRLLEGVGLLR